MKQLIEKYPAFKQRLIAFLDSERQANWRSPQWQNNASGVYKHLALLQILPLDYFLKESVELRAIINSQYF
jgi:hypothetical protein